MSTTFSTTVEQAAGKNATGLRVPTDVVAGLGSHKRPQVTVSLNGYTYRSTVAAHGDVFMLPLSAEHRAAAGVQAGDRVEVTIAPPLTRGESGQRSARSCGHPSRCGGRGP